MKTGLVNVLQEKPLTKQEIIAGGYLGPRAFSSLIPALLCDGYIVLVDGQYQIARIHLQMHPE